MEYTTNKILHTLGTSSQISFHFNFEALVRKVGTAMNQSVVENEAFENAFQGGPFRKRRFHVVVWTGENGAFRKHSFKASIYDLCGMRMDLWGSRRGVLIVCCLLSKFEYRILNIAPSSCGRGYFRKYSSCGRSCVFIRIERCMFENM